MSSPSSPFGPLLIWGPATVWLYLGGHIGAAVFVVVWSIAAAFVTDNVLKPWLISRGSDLPLILILFGVVGGVVTFGFLGLFLGPTLLAVGYELIREWSAVRAEASDAMHEDCRLRRCPSRGAPIPRRLMVLDSSGAATSGAMTPSLSVRRHSSFGRSGRRGTRADGAGRVEPPGSSRGSPEWRSTHGKPSR